MMTMDTVPTVAVAAIAVVAAALFVRDEFLLTPIGVALGVVADANRVTTVFVVNAVATMRACCSIADLAPAPAVASAAAGIARTARRTRTRTAAAATLLLRRIVLLRRRWRWEFLHGFRTGTR